MTAGATDQPAPSVGETPVLTKPLGRVAARGAAVTIVGQTAKVVIQLVGIVVLARLLSPREYGLLAMVVAFTGIGDLLRDFGLSSASIQARTVSPAQRSNLFWLNTAIGCALAVIAFLCAVPISWIYDQNDVVRIMQILAIVFLFEGLSTQFRADLNRKMRFARLAALDLTAQVLALTLAVVLAALGAGVWALVAQQVLQAMLVLLLLLAFAPIQISRPQRGVPMAGFLRFGGSVLMMQLLTYASRNVDSLVVGSRFGATELGGYNRAFQLLSLPLNQINAPASTVALPVLSRLQDDPPRFDRFLLRGQGVLMNLVLAIFAFAASQAHPLIILVLGDQWAPSVHLFQILAVAGAFQSAGYASYWVFLAKGRPDASLRYSLVGRPALILIVIAGSLGGVTGVAVAYAAGTALLWPLGLWWIHATTGAPGLQLFIQGMRAVAAYATCAVLATMVPPMFTDDLVYMLLLGIAVLVMTYAVILALWPAFRRSVVMSARTVSHLKARSVA